LRWLLWKKGYGIVDRRLYLPDAWFSDEYKDSGNNVIYLRKQNFKPRMRLPQK